jgi:putative endonuclease
MLAGRRRGPDCPAVMLSRGEASPWCNVVEMHGWVSIVSDGYVYIMSNVSRTLYVGVTNDLGRRVYEHKRKAIPGFTRKYNLTMLVYFEAATGIRSAIEREKQIKGWLRVRKVSLVESVNPHWLDLSAEWR